MKSQDQRVARRGFAARATGPKTAEGKRRVSVNATLHGLSTPLDQQLYSKEIEDVRLLVLAECLDDLEALELAKRIIQFERCESFVINTYELGAYQLDRDDLLSPLRQILADWTGVPTEKLDSLSGYTAVQKKLNGHKTSKELKIIKDFLSVEEKMFMEKVRHFKRQAKSSVRYQKRALNQLRKALKKLAA